MLVERTQPSHFDKLVHNPYVVPSAKNDRRQFEAVSMIGNKLVKPDTSSPITPDMIEEKNRINDQLREMGKTAVKTALASGKTVFDIVTINVNIARAWLEFFGDYGPELNNLRYRIWGATVPNRVLANLPDEELTAILRVMYPSREVQPADFRTSARQLDLTKGSTLEEVTCTTSNVPQTGEQKSEDPVFDLIAIAREIKRTKNLPDSVISNADIADFEKLIKELGHNKILALTESLGKKAKDGIQAFMKLELSLMQLNLEHKMPAMHMTGTDLDEDTGSYGPKKQIVEFMFGAEVLEAMSVKENAARFSEESILRALENEINVSCWTKQDRITPLKPADLACLTTPGCLRLFMATLLCAKMHDACKVATPTELNAGRRDYLRMIGTDEEIADTLANRLKQQGAGLIGLQECNPAVLSSLKQQGYFNTRHELPEKEQVGTTICASRELFHEAVVEHKHTYLDDKGRGGKLKLMTLLGKEIIGNIALFVANLHGDAAKSGDDVEKLDALKKLKEAHRVWKHVQITNAKPLNFVAMGDFNVKSDAEMEAVLNWANENGVQLTYVDKSTLKLRVFTFMTLKAGEWKLGNCDIVATSLTDLVALETLLGGKRETSNEYQPNRGHPFDHKDVALRVAATPKRVAESKDDGEVRFHVGAPATSNEGQGIAALWQYMQGGEGQINAFKAALAQGQGFEQAATALRWAPAGQGADATAAQIDLTLELTKYPQGKIIAMQWVIDRISQNSEDKSLSDILQSFLDGSRFNAKELEPFAPVLIELTSQLLNDGQPLYVGCSALEILHGLALQGLHHKEITTIAERLFKEKNTFDEGCYLFWALSKYKAAEDQPGYSVQAFVQRLKDAPQPLVMKGYWFDKLVESLGEQDHGWDLLTNTASSLFKNPEKERAGLALFQALLPSKHGMTLATKAIYEKGVENAVSKELQQTISQLQRQERDPR